MIEFLKSQNLADKTISFYEQLYGKRPLTLNEMHLLNPSLSKQELVEIINDLFQARLITKITPEDSSIVGQYAIIPPFITMGEIISQIKNAIAGKEDTSVIFEHAIGTLFKNQNKVELDNIYKDFKQLQDDINNDINTIKHELEELVNQIEKKEDKLEFLDKFETELKNLINSQLASIVIILLQMKADFQEKLKEIGISNTQWSALKDTIKDTLALGIHEKSGELGEIVSEEFKEIKRLLTQQHTDVLKDRFEQKSVYLGILNIFKTEIDKFHKALLLKKNNLNLDLKSLEKSLLTEIAQTFQNQIGNVSQHIIQLEKYFQIFLEGYSGTYKTSTENLWPIYSSIKISEEISNALRKSSEKLVIIVPTIDDFIPLKALNSSSETLKIELISSDSHTSEVVKSLSNNINIEFKRLKKNREFIGVHRDNSWLMLGLYQNLEKDPLKNVIGFSTNDSELINFLFPLFSEKREAAKPPKTLQITNAFNDIIENINEIKGKTISKKLQEVLDIAFKMKGISLDVLELKLLINKLQNVNSPLNNDWKTHVIEKIVEFNTKFSNVELKCPPEFKSSISEVIGKETDLQPLDQTITADHLEEANAMFDLFLEKLEGLKGVEMSEKLESMIEMVIKFQGFSNIIEWKENLKNLNEIPQTPFIEKLREDLALWRSRLITPKAPETPPAPHLEESVSLEDKEYHSPAFSEPPKDVEESKSEVIEEKSIYEIFSEISQNLDKLTGFEISGKLQAIMDIVLETKGYSIALKDMRQWISKLRMIKTPLVDDIKMTFKEKLNKWKNEAL